MIWKSLERHADLGLLLARLGFGLGFVWYHGLPKLLGGAERLEGTGRAMGSLGIEVAPQWFGLAAALAETVGGLMIAAGFLFRPAAAAIMFVMFVATVNHIVTGVGTPAHSFKNAWILLGLVFIGPGRYSVDHMLTERRGRPAPRGAPTAERERAPV
jgi:putative oxidoreductase